MKKITVAVVDDHQLVREMWTEMFAGRKDMEITGSSGEFDDAIKMIGIKQPDIVLLDINLSSDSGFDAVPLIRNCSPSTNIIAVSMNNQPAYAKKMLKLGAKGYITKNSSFGEIFTAIEKVMKGEIYVCSDIKDVLSEKMFKHPGTPGLNDLSRRETEIVWLLKAGMSSSEIGTSLHISRRTAEAHRYNILKKMNLKNTASLINFVNTENPLL